MADYAEDAMLITPEGVLKGRTQIQQLFTKIFSDSFPPRSSSLNLTKQVVEGEVAYILWSGSSARYKAPFCTDTFKMHDGKIAWQTFAAQLEAK